MKAQLCLRPPAGWSLEKGLKSVTPVPKTNHRVGKSLIRGP